VPKKQVGQNTAVHPFTKITNSPKDTENNSMKVLHLVKTSRGATWALRQMRELVKLDVDVHVVLPAYSANASKYQAAGINVHIKDMDLSPGSVFRLPFQIQQCKKILEKIQPDLVHSHFYATTLLMRLAMRRSPIPKIFQVPGPLHLEHVFFRTLEILLADENDHWVASCEWTKTKYESLLPDKTKVFLSYYGTDTDNFVKQKKGCIYDELGISEKTKVIGMVAYMYPPRRYLGQKRGLKGHEDLIDAVSLLIDQGKDVALVFVGGAWAGATAYENKVMAYGKKKLGNRVFFLGTRSDVTRLYSGFDMAVHPSHSENVGGAVESLLMKIPTITTDIGGFPDVIKHKQTGLLAKPGNPDDLAQKMLYYLENPDLAEKNSLKGYAYTRQLFDVKRTAKEIKKIYETILLAHRHLCIY
jgi:glycosyltransferase involved in cell wall biosynthesis